MKTESELTSFARTLAVPGVSPALFFYDSAARPEDTARYMNTTPVILIHGLGDEADTWRHIFPIFAKTRRVIAPDLPGFGRSVARGHPSIERHANAVRALLPGSGKAILVGNSLGAAIAELVAFREPDRVAALALIDGGLPSGGALTPGLIASLFPGVIERGYRAWRHDHEGAYRSLDPYYANLESLSQSDRDFLRARVIERVESETQCRAYGSSFRSYLRTAIFRSAWYARRLAALKVPLLVVWGERDRIIPISARDSLLALRPDTRAETVPESGHLPHQERPHETGEILSRFFDEIDQG
jgi:pimeloyl-ACP methyl ester carboxylesterase